MDRNRKLKLQEHERAVRLYVEMSKIFTSKEDTYHDTRPILARNRLVEVAITECCEAVGCNERVLLEAWRIWVFGRDLYGLTWPVTKFQQEMDAPVEQALGKIRDEDELASYRARRAGAR